MFKFLKKNKKTEPTQEEEKVYPATIAFTVDNDGNIFVDGSWKTEAHTTAPFMFAELLTKVSGGDMFLDTLVFLKEFCIENEAEELYDQLLVFIRKIQESKKTKKSSELVVKPTDYSKKATFENVSNNENDIFGG
jgi:hypothetical protein